MPWSGSRTVYVSARPACRRHPRTSMAHLIDKLPAALARRLRTRFGWHFSRFALVAIASLGVTQATLAILYLAGVTPGLATLAGWMAGALTSYLLSRWAW